MAKKYNPCECRSSNGVGIVDDDPELAGMLKTLMLRRKIRVSFIAKNGGEALKEFSEAAERPGIIIMDYRLPDMTGIEVMRDILKLEPNTRVIFLSADAMVREKAISAGAVIFLKKPASIDKIIDAVSLTTLSPKIL